MQIFFGQLFAASAILIAPMQDTEDAHPQRETPSVEYVFDSMPDVERTVSVRIEATPAEIGWGDVVFIRIRVRNVGSDPISVAGLCRRDMNLARLKLADESEHTRFEFAPHGAGSGGVAMVRVKARESITVLYDVLPMPHMAWADWSFWKFAARQAKSYRVHALLRLDNTPLLHHANRPEIRIEPRREEEIAALREFYNGGIHAPSPPGWDWDRPTLGLFGAIGFPLVASLPDELAAIEQELSAGSLRDAVHGTWLTARLYDANTLDGRREAADELLEWLDARHEIARHWMAMRLSAWATRNQGLGEYRFEFVDRLISRGPEEYGGRNWKEKYRKENESLRQHHLELRQRRQVPRESSGVKRATGERPDPAPVSADEPATLTPSDARLLGNIRAAGGRFWLPGRAWRPWEPRPGVPTFGVELPGRAATREVIAALGELSTVEYLAIVGPEAPDDALAGLPALRDLRILSLRDTRISDAALQHLRELPELEWVELGHTDNQGTGIQGDGLKHLQTLPKLQYLFLTRTDVDDAALAHVSNMKGLVSLGLDFNKISDRGLKHLQGLTELRFLNLRWTKITDEGLEHLAPLKQLERLNLLGTRVTPEGVARLREALPDLQIVGAP